jgi:DDE superfamily endonuclease
MTGYEIEAQHQQDLAGLRMLRARQIQAAEDLSRLAYGRAVTGWQLHKKPFSPFRSTVFWMPAPSFCAPAHVLLFFPESECIVGARFHPHYTPTHASWLNQVELFFSILARRLLKRGEFASVTELVDRIMAFIAEYNRTAKPFRWTYDGRPLQAA